MAQNAELIFLSGPQQGQRAALVGRALAAGRSPDCHVHLLEEHVSRQQLRLELTPDGWLVENLSASRPIRINDRKFKPGKKILLDTGDVVGVGLMTEMLFVAPGADSEAAYQQWCEDHPVRQAEVLPPEDESGPGKDKASQAGAPLPAEDPTAAPAETPSTADEASQLPEEEVLAKKRAAKLKKYGILFGVYALVMIGVILLLSHMRTTNIVREGPPAQLTKMQITDSIKSRFERTPNFQVSGRLAEKAMGLYRTRRNEAGNLYRCVKYFKLYLAYAPNHVPRNPTEAQAFDNATNELVTLVYEKYSNAWLYEQSKSWRNAKDRFEELLRILPVKDDPEPEDKNMIFDNVLDHITYVGNQLNANKR